jgi:RES domain-containing protein
LTIYRIHGAGYPVFDTSGAVLREGRWHRPGTRIVYAAQHVSLAALELLVHANSQAPPPKSITAIEIPDSLAIEYAGWMDLPGSQAFGSSWAEERRTAVLAVPSIVVHGMELNFALNPAHPDFASIAHGPAQPFAFDPRFFAGPAVSR